MEQNRSGKLYIVATPIGNLKDITERALEVLESVDIVVCEDTRVTGKLLHHFGIKKKLISHHQHSSDRLTNQLINQLTSGVSIAYMTDSGTPGISDPVQRLIAQIRNPKSEILNKSQISQPKADRPLAENIQIVPIPGPSAVTTAVSVSGLVEKEFYFVGFLPKKKGRQTKLKELSKYRIPIIIYESAQRLERTLGDIVQYFGDDTEVFIAREMTKMFEEYWGGNIDEVINDLKAHKLKGEIVLIVKSSKKHKNE